MKRNWHRRAKGGLPILSAALMSAGALMLGGTWSSAAAQSSNEVIVDYDALNALSGQPAEAPAQPVTPQQPQVLPGYAPSYGVTALPPYAPYGIPPQGMMQPPPMAPAIALQVPPAGTPSSVLTTLGPDGRPITPIKLRKPGSQPAPESAGASSQVAAVTPPPEAGNLPDEVPMPEPTPPAPEAGVNADMPVAAPVVETPAPPAEGEAPAAEAPAPEQPAAEQPAEQAAQEAPAEQPAAESAATPPAEAETPEAEPTEEAAAETPPEPDNTQPAPPVPQGGIRIVFPTELNEVPAEANAALDDLAAQMVADDSMRIQIMCYSSGTEDTESKARRKSLQRCINIRQYLFKKDVRTTRMDVRALGLKSEGQPADRVDIVPAAS
jgi:outer membrane protein OmpA-like peptidoglycan-associated protein